MTASLKAKEKAICHVSLSPAFKGNSSFYKWNSKLLAMSHQIPHVLVLLTSLISDCTTPPCLSCTDLLALPWTGLALSCLRAFALLPLSVISHFRKKKSHILGTCPVVHWLRLCIPNAEGMGSIPGWGTRIPHAPACHTGRCPGTTPETDLIGLRLAFKKSHL